MDDAEGAGKSAAAQPPLPPPPPPPLPPPLPLPNAAASDMGGILDMITANRERLTVRGAPLLSRQRAEQLEVPAVAAALVSPSPLRAPFVTRVSLAELMTPPQHGAGGSALGSKAAAPLLTAPVVAAPPPTATASSSSSTATGRIELTVEELIRLVAAAAHSPPPVAASDAGGGGSKGGGAASGNESGMGRGDGSRAATPLPPLASLLERRIASPPAAPVDLSPPTAPAVSDENGGEWPAAAPSHAAATRRAAGMQTPAASAAAASRRDEQPTTDRAQRAWELRFQQPQPHYPMPPSQRAVSAAVAAADALLPQPAARVRFAPPADGEAPEAQLASPSAPTPPSSPLDVDTSVGRLLRDDDAERRALARSQEAKYEFVRAVSEAMHRSPRSLAASGGSGGSGGRRSRATAAATPAVQRSGRSSASDASARFFAEQAALSATPGAVFAFPRAAPPSTLRRPRASLAHVASPDERFVTHQKLYAGLVHASDDEGSGRDSN